uniref:Uncharacterized protein n=1 Tax=Candidatus Methanophaga sp. ANME-1 ERB7 TaxID=2759913 RepID=A0A7G9Z2J2_9EURY|nr:hypothetical protein ILIMKHIM_00005 [Methanosarcinales archaeon ANME-1 ERB7]
MRRTDEFTLDRFLLQQMSEKDIDFVAWATSHWHAIGVDAFIYDLSQRENKKLRGVITILPHPKDGFLINEADFICKNFTEVEFCFLDVSQKNQKFTIFRVIKFIKNEFDILLATKNIRNKNKNKKEIYIVSVITPSIYFIRHFRNRYLANKYHPIFVLIDEGLNIYMSPKIWNIVRRYDKQKTRRTLLEGIKLNILNLEVKVLESIVLNYIDIENRFVFNKERFELIPNMHIVESYKKTLDVRKKNHKGKKSEFVAMILTGPFSEYGQVSLEYEINLISRLIEILDRKSFDIIIKPHPREYEGKYVAITRKYNVEIMQNRFPVEDIFPTLNPSCVIGYTSTALLNARFLYNIPAISMINILLEISDDEMLNVSGNDFKKLTNNMSNVFHINGLEEIEDILDDIKTKNKTS